MWLVLSRHWGPKRKLRVGLVRERTSRHRRAMCRHIFFIIECGIARFLCAMRAPCAYSTFGHHPHPVGYLCAKFRFVHGPYYWASPAEKNRVLTQSLIHSLTHSPCLFDARESKRSLRNKEKKLTKERFVIVMEYVSFWTDVSVITRRTLYMNLEVSSGADPQIQCTV